MRSLTDLQALASEHKIETAGFTREQIMDALREKFGTFDPNQQIDPMKAKDLKNEIDWTRSDYGLGKYLTPAYALEPKLDGARMRLFLGAARNSMNTGRRSDRTYAYIDRSDNFPHIRDAVIPELAGTILDGEVLAPAAKIRTMNGIETDSLLNATVALTNVNPTDSVKIQDVYGPVRFYVFDVLAVQGDSVKHVPYAERRKFVEKIAAALNEIESNIMIVSSLPASEEALKVFFDEGFEGGMLKKQDGKYEAGKRSASWLKVKRMSTFDAFITGYVPGKGRNLNRVGALRMSIMGEDGVPVEICQHGAFTDAFRDELSASDGSLKPEWYGRVMECAGQGLTKERRVRHPHLVRIRPDKEATDCGIDQLETLARV